MKIAFLLTAIAVCALAAVFYWPQLAKAAAMPFKASAKEVAEVVLSPAFRRRPDPIVPFEGRHALAQPRAIQFIRADVSDPKAMLAQLTKDWEDFKAEQTTAMKGKADVVVDEKVQKINDSVGALQAAIDDVNRRLAAQALNGQGGPSSALNTPEKAEYAKAFNAFFRTGAGGDQLKALAVKAQLNRQNDPDGGYVVSPEIEQAIDRVLGTSSMMRQLATVRPTGAATYKKRVGLGGATSGWVGENEARAETNTPRIAQIDIEAMTLYAEPEATEEMLEDADFDVAAWLADEVDIDMSEREGAAHISGDGVKKPRGILSYGTVEDDAWAWGSIGYKVSGAAADITTADGFVDLTEALKQGFRPGASWLMNRKTGAKVRKIKDTTGNYIWQPSLELGKPASLLGYGHYSDDNMPDVAAGAYPVAFGDFRRGYLITDRRGIRVLRNPFKNSGFVTFYTTKRVGGGVQHFQAIKLLKVSA